MYVLATLPIVHPATVRAIVVYCRWWVRHSQRPLCTTAYVLGTEQRRRPEVKG
jgi:hypothetical protein